MKYYIYKEDKLLKIADDYPQRGIKENWDIIKVPEEKDIKVGYEVYKFDNSFYGTITRITDCFYYISKPSRPDYESIFVIDSFKEKHMNKVFVVVDKLQN